MNHEYEIAPTLRKDIITNLKNALMRLALFNKNHMGILDELVLEAEIEFYEEIRDSIRMSHLEQCREHPPFS